MNPIHHSLRLDIQFYIYCHMPTSPIKWFVFRLNPFTESSKVNQKNMALIVFLNRTMVCVLAYEWQSPWLENLLELIAAVAVHLWDRISPCNIYHTLWFFLQRYVPEIGGIFMKILRVAILVIVVFAITLALNFGVKVRLQTWTSIFATLIFAMELWSCSSQL